MAASDAVALVRFGVKLPRLNRLVVGDIEIAMRRGVGCLSNT